MVDEVIDRKEALQVDFKTALTSTLTTMGVRTIETKAGKRIDSVLQILGKHL